MPPKQIIVRPISEATLAQDSDLHPVFKRLLAARLVGSLDEIDYRLANMLPLEAIRHLAQAAELLCNCLRAARNILVFGDYDADGATSTALCVRALTLLGHDQVSYLMPDRFIDGYGLSESAARRIVELSPDCVITVDNGIASFEGIALLRAHGIEVIVTDHHLAASRLPDASIIVNQNAWPDETRGKNLAGVGVAFYLMLALRKALRDSGWFDQNRREPNLADCLDLVAIGSIADLVPLDYNNRILVNEGLKRIRGGLCAPGVKALIEISNKQMANLNSSDIAFAIAPKINAAGRLDDMTVGVQCLLADDEPGARALATELNDINLVRKDIQQQMSEEANLQLAALDRDALDNQHGIVLYQPDWHEGIVGIVAAKVREKFHRPSIVFAHSDDGFLKGSGRSIPGIHLRDMLDTVDKRNPGVILKFGGHAMAAGLSLQPQALAQFSQSFEQVIAEFADPACFTECIECDGILEPEYLNLDFAEDLQTLSPWGQRFPAPSFVGEFVVNEQRVLGTQHLKLVLELSERESLPVPTVDAIAFFQPVSVLETRYDKIHIHYELNVNRFRGQTILQLLIRDIL